MFMCEKCFKSKALCFMDHDGDCKQCNIGIDLTDSVIETISDSGLGSHNIPDFSQQRAGLSSSEIARDLLTTQLEKDCFDIIVAYQGPDGCTASQEKRIFSWNIPEADLMYGNPVELAKKAADIVLCQATKECWIEEEDIFYTKENVKTRLEWDLKFLNNCRNED